MTLTVAIRLYRLALYAYPKAFRRRHGAEMQRIFDDDWRAARNAGSTATVANLTHILSDLARSAAHERLDGMTGDDWVGVCTATLCGITAAWIDFRASEVQSTLLVLLAGTAFFSCFGGRRTWRWSLAAAAWLPAAHVAAFALGTEPGVNQTFAHSRLVLPAFAMLLVAGAATFAGLLAGTPLRWLLWPSLPPRDSP